MTAQKKPLPREQLIESTRLSARIQGCLCRPEIRLRELRPQVYSAEVAHNDWCPLAGERGQDA